MPLSYYLLFQNVNVMKSVSYKWLKVGMETELNT